MEAYYTFALQISEIKILQSVGSGPESYIAAHDWGRAHIVWNVTTKLQMMLTANQLTESAYSNTRFFAPKWDSEYRFSIKHGRLLTFWTRALIEPSGVYFMGGKKVLCIKIARLKDTVDSIKYTAWILSGFRF